MTTPSDIPEGPAAEPTPPAAATPPPAPPLPPFAPVPPAPPSAAPPTAGFPTFGGPGPQQPYLDPSFAAVMRPPRSPWINPARRTVFAIISIVAALVLFGGGMLAGWAVTGHGNHRVQPYERSGPFFGGNGPGAHGPFDFGPGHNGARTAPSSTPSATPTS